MRRFNRAERLRIIDDIVLMRVLTCLLPLLLTLEDFPLGFIPPMLCYGGLDDAAVLRVNVGRRQAA